MLIYQLKIFSILFVFLAQGCLKEESKIEKDLKIQLNQNRWNLLVFEANITAEEHQDSYFSISDELLTEFLPFIRSNKDLKWVYIPQKKFPKFFNTNQEMGQVQLWHYSTLKQSMSYNQLDSIKAILKQLKGQ